MVQGAVKYIKWLLFAFNLIFVITGIALIVCGALVQTAFKEYFVFFGQKFNAAAILLIVVGCIIFLIAAFGCFGACTENYVCTMVFAGLMIAIFLLEIAGGITGFVLRDELKKALKDHMNNTMDRYGERGHKGIKTVWDHTQDIFHCCGINDFDDWLKTPYYRVNASLPRSCCNSTVGEDCVTTVPDQFGIWEVGCIDGIENWAKDNIYKIGAAGIAIAVIQILGIIFACCLARGIRKEYEVM